MLHLDWLDVSQNHAIDLDWGPKLRVDYDTATGEMLWKTTLGDDVEGSHDTNIRVRCSLGVVRVSGNPSKFGRLDALTGLTTMSGALEVYNEVLRRLGLPEFRDNGKVVLASGEHVRSCPRASRIDLTQNLVLGSFGAIAPFCDWLSMQRWGRLKISQPHPCYCRAAAKHRRQRVWYAKGEEIREHAKPWARSKADDAAENLAYLKRLAAWCDANGIVRDEVRLLSKVLSESGWTWLDERWEGDGVMSNVIALHGGTVEAMQSDVGAVVDWQTTAVDVLLGSGDWSERQAHIITNWLLGWMGGKDPRTGISKATFYKRAKAVRVLLGVDVRSAPNIASLGVRVRAAARVVEATVLETGALPEWYRHAA